MVVRDVQTNEQWVFLANRWFAVEEDDGQVRGCGCVRVAKRPLIHRLTDLRSSERN